MKTIVTALRKLLSEEDGLETVEYAVIAALITGAAILALTLLGTDVAAKFNDLASKISS